MRELEAFDKLRADIIVHVKPTLEIRVDNEEQGDSAIEAGMKIKAYINAVEQKRVELVKPLNAKVKQINDYAKKLKEPLGKSEIHLKSELCKFSLEQERKRKADLERIEREKEAKLELESKRQKKEREDLKRKADQEAEIQREVDELIGRDGSKNESKVDDSQDELEAKHKRESEQLERKFENQKRKAEDQKVKNTRKIWKFEIVDLEKLSRKYMKPDEVVIRQAIKVGLRDIAGVRIYEETTVALSSGR